MPSTAHSASFYISPMNSTLKSLYFYAFLTISSVTAIIAISEYSTERYAGAEYDIATINAKTSKIMKKTANMKNLSQFILVSLIGGGSSPHAYGIVLPALLLSSMLLGEILPPMV